MKKGWTYKKLKELYPIVMGKTPPRAISKFWDPNKETHNLWVSIADLSKNEGKEIIETKEYISNEAIGNITKVKKGSLLVSFKLTLGKMAFAGEDLYTNEAIMSLGKHDDIDLRFLYYYFSSLDWGKLATGNEKVKGKTLNKKSLGEIPVAMLSKAEQERIVERLDAAFAQIDELKSNAEKQLAEARALFQSALTQAMQPKQGWQEFKIMEICEVIGGTTPNTSNPNYWGGDNCWISPAELHGEKYLYDSVKKITEEAVIAKNLKLLPEGTVILSSRAPIGKVAINKVPMYCNQGFKCIVCGPKIFNEFLYWWLWGNTDYLNSIGTGATFAEISKTVVQNISIRIPSKPEQEIIAAHLDRYYSFVHRLEHIQNEITAECDAMKQALLRQIFE